MYSTLSRETTAAFASCAWWCLRTTFLCPVSCAHILWEESQNFKHFNVIPVTFVYSIFLAALLLTCLNGQGRS